eukprot:NODE_6582_length_836_cov_36.625526_g6346_i0.p1 GENE.NODE_6582_length_836_cov_36.625526_g6346_i0~~NODE_6582_length_836_cov_36.625526_g6346_i0.p1  ORF type:complete len:255 (+),score=40.90 NODE_6582_length_836_cov_36.625526_g6346_i0:69-833(+)
MARPRPLGALPLLALLLVPLYVMLIPVTDIFQPSSSSTTNDDIVAIVPVDNTVKLLSAAELEQVAKGVTLHTFPTPKLKTGARSTLVVTTHGPAFTWTWKIVQWYDVCGTSISITSGDLTYIRGWQQDFHVNGTSAYSAVVKFTKGGRYKICFLQSLPWQLARIINVEGPLDYVANNNQPIYFPDTLSIEVFGEGLYDKCPLITNPIQVVSKASGQACTCDLSMSPTPTPTTKRTASYTITPAQTSLFKSRTLR